MAKIIKSYISIANILGRVIVPKEQLMKSAVKELFVVARSVVDQLIQKIVF